MRPALGQWGGWCSAGGRGGAGLEAIEGEVRAQVRTRHGRSSRLSWAQRCVPGGALILSPAIETRPPMVRIGGASAQEVGG